MAEKYVDLDFGESEKRFYGECAIEMEDGWMG